MDPTPLFAGLREHLPHRAPEAETAVADGQIGIDREPAVPDIQEQLAPRLLALAIAVRDRDQLLRPLPGCADQHQNTLPVVVRVLEPDVEVDAVGPDVDIAPPRQGALGPPVLFLLPDGLQPRNRGRRQTLRVGA